MFEFTGKIINVKPVVKITGKFKEKCIFIVEEGSRKIAFVLFDDDIYKLLEPLEIGDKVTVSFSVKSAEFSGSWVTNCFALDIKKAQNKSNQNKQNNWNYQKTNNFNKSYSVKPDPYFPLNCTKEEAKKIYRELCKKYHPDMPQGSHQKMQEINKSYEKFK